MSPETQNPGEEFLISAEKHTNSPDSPAALTLSVQPVNVTLQLFWRRSAASRRPLLPSLPLYPSLLSLTLRSANKNVFVQINRRGCSSTFQCIFYEGHAVSCRCCCSDEGPAPPIRRRGKIPVLKKCAGECLHLKQEVCFRFQTAGIHTSQINVWGRGTPIAGRKKGKLESVDRVRWQKVLCNIWNFE